MIVRESLSFERGKTSKEALGIGRIGMEKNEWNKFVRNTGNVFGKEVQMDQWEYKSKLVQDRLLSYIRSVNSPKYIISCWSTSIGRHLKEDFFVLSFGLNIEIRSKEIIRKEILLYRDGDLYESPDYKRNYDSDSLSYIGNFGEILMELEKMMDPNSSYTPRDVEDKIITKLLE